MKLDICETDIQREGKGIYFSSFIQKGDTPVLWLMKLHVNTLGTQLIIKLSSINLNLAKRHICNHDIFNDQGDISSSCLMYMGTYPKDSLIYKSAVPIVYVWVCKNSLVTRIKTPVSDSSRTQETLGY